MLYRILLELHILDYALWLFLLNLLALGSGLILKRMGRLKAARILSYTSLVGVSATMLILIVWAVVFWST